MKNKKELFISDKCPDCKNLIDEFEKDPDSLKSLDWEIINITDSMLNLKKFLKYRDNLVQYKHIKDENMVGIPSLVINEGEEVIFHFEHKFKDSPNTL